MIYGRIRFFNEDGEIGSVDCLGREDYERELAAAARWIEAEPRRSLEVQGEVPAADPGRATA